MAEKQKNTEERDVLGILRLTRIYKRKMAIFSIFVAEEWQKKGIGSKLIELMIDVAKQEQIDMIRARMLTDNVIMQKILQKKGFVVEKNEKDPSYMIAYYDVRGKK